MRKNWNNTKDYLSIRTYPNNYGLSILVSFLCKFSNYKENKCYYHYDKKNKNLVFRWGYRGIDLVELISKILLLHRNICLAIYRNPEVVKKYQYEASQFLCSFPSINIDSGFRLFSFSVMDYLHAYYSFSVVNGKAVFTGNLYPSKHYISVSEMLSYFPSVSIINPSSFLRSCLISSSGKSSEPVTWEDM